MTLFCSGAGAGGNLPPVQVERGREREFLLFSVHAETVTLASPLTDGAEIKRVRLRCVLVSRNKINVTGEGACLDRPRDEPEKWKRVNVCLAFLTSSQGLRPTGRRVAGRQGSGF